MTSVDALRREIAEVHPTASLARNLSMAVVLPCYNEGPAIGAVVRAFQQRLPGAVVYVFDNNSTDNTRAAAEEAGAIVFHERRQGKGNVVRRMFADVEADIYIMADGDGSYDTASVGRLIDRLVTGHFDMVVGARAPEADDAHRQGHATGNRLFNSIVRRLFGRGFTDIFSGYRVFTRRFAKSFPAMSSGFEIETELTVHALDLRMPVDEMPLPFGKRTEGTTSKLKTFRDGFRILFTIASMYRVLQPMRFFMGWFVAFWTLSIVLGVPLVLEYAQTGAVSRLPTVVLTAALMQIAITALACGFILEGQTEARREFKRLRYLELPSLASRR